MTFDQTGLARFLKNENPALFGKLCELRTAVEGWLSYIPQSFPHYTRHTVLHSDTILMQMSKLLFDDDNSIKPVLPISPMEVYVAAAAAYLHDSGMVISDASKARIMQTDDWKSWIEVGAASRRWSEILAFRNGRVPEDAALRNFLADVQMRFLIAEFVRRMHHLRAKDILSENEDQFGRFAFNNRSLLETIADVCVAHGLQQSDLEDRERYPERRDIDGYQVNVRFAAILLRLGDLLDMSHDRACPLLLNAACPLPPESLAHWTQYGSIRHSMTAPDRIEITAECQNQEEHRFLTDWCRWLTEELRNAAILFSRATRHRGWTPPVASMDTPDATIQIRPARNADYVPSRWKFEFDADTVFTRLIEDVYDSPNVFIRELIQNAADANRCQMYLDLKSQGLATPEFPTSINEAIRQRYGIHIALEQRQVLNEMSGESEMRQAVIIEDCGIGMDRDIIERFFLQVGRSFYSTKDFLRHFKFSPTSHFGLGFLSTFAVSERITVDTFKPSSSSADGPLRFVLTGPRNYLLTRKGQRRSNGTRIEVLLRQHMQDNELTAVVRKWCLRVEFPIYIDDLGVPSTITAEQASDFIEETPDVSTAGGKFIIRAFDINRSGLEGELYVFAHITDEGESWTDYRWASTDYLKTSPEAVKPKMPGSVRMINGISVGPYHTGESRAVRIDVRDGSLPPTLSRSSVRYRYRDESDSRIESRWVDILKQDLPTTAKAQGQHGWIYKQALMDVFPIRSVWETMPETIQFQGLTRGLLLSLQTASTLPVFRTVLRKRPYATPPPLVLTENIPTLTLGERRKLSSLCRRLLFTNRWPSVVHDLGEHYFAIDWTLMKTSTELVVGYTVQLPWPGVVGIEIHDTGDRIGGDILLNQRHQFVQWFLRIVECCKAGQHVLKQEQLQQFVALVESAIRYPSSRADELEQYLKHWSDMKNVPEELHPPGEAIGRDSFHVP